MDNSLLSVIVPVYNVEKYIDECIESICNQTYKNLEIILVDDGSTDNSGKRCDYWAEQDNRIKVIHKQNGGLSSARNAGLDIINGEYVAFVDSDDVLSTTMYQEMMERRPDDKCIVACDYTKIDENGNEIPKTCDNFADGIYSPQDFLASYDNARIRITVAVAWNKIYPVSVFKDIRYKEGITHEDEEIIHRLFFNTSKIVFVAKELYKYRTRSGSIMKLLNPASENDLFNALINRLYDCYDGQYSAQSLSKIATYCIEQGISIWIKCSKSKKGSGSEKNIIRTEVKKIIKEKEKYGLKKIRIKWLLFTTFPNVFNNLYKIKNMK